MFLVLAWTAPEDAFTSGGKYAEMRGYLVGLDQWDEGRFTRIAERRDAKMTAMQRMKVLTQRFKCRLSGGLLKRRTDTCGSEVNVAARVERTFA